MAGEREREQAFSRIVDRLLAGEQASIDPETEQSLARELEFARKMIAVRPSPDPGFQASLKAKLLQRLAEQEAQARRYAPWWQRLLPQTRAWQAVAAMLFVFVIGGILWATGIFRPAGLSPGSIIAVEASTNKATYRPGEQVKIEVTLRNVTSQPLEIKEFPPILSLMSADSRQPVYTFVPAQAAKTLAPDERAEFTLAWDQRDARGRPAPGGGYYIELEDLESRGRAIPLNLTHPARFNILD